MQGFDGKGQLELEIMTTPRLTSKQEGYNT